MSERVHVVVEGKVQGVAYRAWTERSARALGLSGWVRNRREGTVEALFCGPADRVSAMLARCREGPPAARVSNVRSAPFSGEWPAGFTILPDV